MLKESCTLVVQISWRQSFELCGKIVFKRLFLSETVEALCSLFRFPEDRVCWVNTIGLLFKIFLYRAGHSSLTQGILCTFFVQVYCKTKLQTNFLGDIALSPQ